MATLIDDKHEKYWLSLSFCEAIRTKYPKPQHELNRMLDQGLPADAIVVNKESFLSLAACWGNTDLAKELLKRGAPVNHVNIFGDTALTYAVKGGHKEIAEMLITADADAFLSIPYTEGKSLVEAAQELGWEDIGEKLAAARDAQLPALADKAVRLQTPVKTMHALKLKAKVP